MYSFSDNVIHKDGVPVLGIAPETAISAIINDMAQRIAELESRLSKEQFAVASESSAIEAKDIVVSGPSEKSEEAITLEGNNLDVNLVKDGTTVTLSYNALPSSPLPGAYKVTGTFVRVDGQKQFGKTKIATTKQPIMKMDIPISRFPVTLDATVTITTPRGDLDLKRKINISAEEVGDQIHPMEIIDRTPSSATTKLDDRLNQLDLRLKNVENGTKR